MSAGKVALIIGLVVVALGAAVCGGGYLWVRAHSDELTQMGKTAFKDGAHFGEHKDGDACVAEAERRLAGLDGILAEAGNKVFLEGCLKTASIAPDFCAGVPPVHEIGASASWGLARCAGQPQSCTRLIGAVQERCSTGPAGPR